MFTSNDEKLRFIAKEIDVTERQMSNLRHSIAAYVKNQDKLRKRTLELTICLDHFSETEAPQVKEFLSAVSVSLKEREKLRELMTARMSVMSQEPLRIYKTMCGKVKKEIKNREQATEIKNKKQTSLEKIIVKESGNRAKINQSQQDLIAASHDVTATTSVLVESVSRFETQKRHDLKVCISDMIWNEINFHSKALESLSKLHANLHARDLTTDLEEINERINLHSGSRPSSPSRSSKSSPRKSESSPRKSDLKRKESLKSATIKQKK